MNGKRPAEPTPGGTGKKRKKEVMVEFSSAVTEEILKKQVAEAWGRRTPFSHEAIVMHMDPFLHCVIPNFIPSPNFLEGLQKELLNLDFHEKYNDLYKFQQVAGCIAVSHPFSVSCVAHLQMDKMITSLHEFYLNVKKLYVSRMTEILSLFMTKSDDLKKRREPHICALRKILFEDFRAWLSDISKIDLEPTIDMSCAKYEFSDALLCHDDELEGRRIAFILYLVPPWDGSLGGTLDLYSVDEYCQPKQIVKSLTPSWNTLVFFEVSPVSFHQVSEVLSEEKSRLSISGWFHGPSLARPPAYFEPPVPRSPHVPQDHEVLCEWINPTYLDVGHQIQIQEEFEEQSEILLKDFLQPEKFAEVCEALEKGGVKWSSRGPPNKRFYERAEESTLPDVLRDCMRLFRSEALFLLLSNFTGLRLHFLAPSEEGGMEDTAEGEVASASDSTDEGTSGSSFEPQDSQAASSSSSSRRSSEQADPEPEEQEAEKGPSIPTCQGELRRWKTGHYTLIHDNGKTEFALDLILYCGCEGWEPEYGGFTSYIAKGEDEELLTVNPENNSLALVYRDRETLKFVKHINHRSLEQKKTFPNRTGFWDFSFVYYE